MAKRKRKLNKKKVVFAIVVAFVLLFGAYKGISFTISTISNIFKSDDKKVEVVKPTNQQEQVYVVALDPGHGGEDGGAVSDSNETYLEKNITLQIAQYVGEELENNNIEVVYTRESDMDLGKTNVEGLDARVKVAADAQADCFVSLHVNSSEPDIKVRGFEAFYNIKDEKSSILSDNIMAQVDTLDFVASTKKTRGDNILHIVYKSKMPTVLLEMGYINDEKDVKYLTEPAKQKELAKKIATGIIKTLEEN